jgi:hypothetical protein
MCPAVDRSICRPPAYRLYGGATAGDGGGRSMYRQALAASGVEGQNAVERTRGTEQVSSCLQICAVSLSSQTPETACPAAPAENPSNRATSYGRSWSGGSFMVFIGTAMPPGSMAVDTGGVRSLSEAPDRQAWADGRSRGAISGR